MSPTELPMVPTAPAHEADGSPAGRRFRVEGMDCGACARTVEKTIAALDGVSSAQVSFGTGTLVLDGDATDADVAAAVSRAGYRARPADRRADGPRIPFWRRDPRAMSTTLSAVLLLLAVAASLAGAPRVVAEPAYLVSMAVGGWPIARAALAALARRSLDMNVLMTLAAVGAVGIGAYAEGAWVLVLFALGTTLESFALERGRRSMEALLELSPAEARILDEGQERDVPVEAVRTGMEFVVRPGERVALDGIVTTGASSVDQSPITGESVPVDKQPGDEVFAGSLNTHGGVLLGVRFVRVDGRPMTAWQALGREFAEETLVWLSVRPLPPVTVVPAKFMLWTLNIAWLLLDADRRALDDVLAGTRVVAATPLLRLP